MIIQSSNVNLFANRSYHQSSAVSTSTTTFSSATFFDTAAALLQDKNEESAENVNTQQVRSSRMSEKLHSMYQIRMQALDYLLRLLFHQGIPQAADSATQETSEADTATADSTNAYRLETTRTINTFTYHEDETTSFQTNGSVVTSDGRSIDFELELIMSRSFTESASEYIDFSSPVLCDPLVINLDVPTASVLDQKFLFDLDADGTDEEVSMLGAGSGYLALDVNEDGIINNGSELFGTKSGNGFEDLASYDLDKNGWIDEADSVFSKLKVWCMHEDGTSELISLKDAGVGAIYLGNQRTDFSLNDAANNTNAVVRRTGLFLYENGGMSTVQQLDLAT